MIALDPIVGGPKNNGLQVVTGQRHRAACVLVDITGIATSKIRELASRETAEEAVRPLIVDNECVPREAHL
jgi:hypothetical protein